MSMREARIIVVVVGVLLPYAARLPRGAEWLQQYTDTGLAGSLLFGAFNAIALGAILAVSLPYRRPLSLLAPFLAGFELLAWAHYSLDLAADAQAAIALIFVPFVALAPVLVGAASGTWWIGVPDLRAPPNDSFKPTSQRGDRRVSFLRAHASAAPLPSSRSWECWRGPTDRERGLVEDQRRLSENAA